MYPTRPIRLITIDLDDTVWPCAPVIREAEDALYAWLCARAPRLTAVHDHLSLREHRRVLMERHPEIAHDVTAVRLQSLRALLLEFDYAPALAGDAMAVFQQQRNRVQPYADTAAALARLRARCRLVSITNGNAEVQSTPLRDAFDRSVTAAEAGAAKPDPAMFRLAMDWAGAAPEETLHIGDDPHRDVEAARRAGLRSIWVNRYRAQWPPDLAPPELEVGDLAQLADWLERDAPCGVCDAL
jgi:putative hydrolase of the HAD superfamily